MADRIQIRGDTKRNWINTNPILALNEMVIESSGIYNNIKIGNGINNYSELPYLSSGSDGGISIEELINHNMDPNAHLSKFNSKLDIYDAIPLIKNVEQVGDVDKSIIFTRFDNTIITIDMPISAVVSGGFFDPDYLDLVIILTTGEEVRIPVSGLIDDYTGSTTSTIQLNISNDNIISANINGGSVSKLLLTLDLQNLLNDLEEKSHFHYNKTTLDTISSTDIENWNSGGDAAKKYSYTFNSTTNWSGTNPYTITINQSTHLLGLDFISDLYILNNSTYKKFENFPTNSYWVSVDNLGNYTINARTPFSGKVVLIG